MTEGPRRRRQSPPEEKKESPVTELDEMYSEMQDRVCKLLDVPEDFKLHLRAVRREFLLAIRSLIDARIASIEEGDRRQRGRRRGRVAVE